MIDRIVSERDIRLAVRHSVEERIVVAGVEVVASLDTVETVVGSRIATVAEIGRMPVEVALMDMSSVVGVY